MFKVTITFGIYEREDSFHLCLNSHYLTYGDKLELCLLRARLKLALETFLANVIVVSEEN